jgi:hypothetical protein
VLATALAPGVASPFATLPGLKDVRAREFIGMLAGLIKVVLAEDIYALTFYLMLQRAIWSLPGDALGGEGPTRVWPRAVGVHSLEDGGR